MNTCIICQTKQSAQISICRTCGFPLRLPKFLSNMQYESWMSEEVMPRRKQWNSQQKQQELTAQEIAELKQAVAELQKQNLALTAAIQELPELKRRVAELQKQLQSSPQPTQTPVSPTISLQKPVQPPLQKKQVSAAKNSELTPQQADYIVSSTVTEICDKAFWGKSFKTVYIPDSVKKIGNAAFKSCSYMHNIRLSDNLQEIGDSAFSDCTELQEIYLPNTVTKIGNSVFKYCTSLQKIHLPDSLTSIGYSVFEDCTGLQEIHLPDSLTSIGYSAFYNCTGLQEIHLPDSLTCIGNVAFYNCTGLQEIHLPDSLTSIGSSVFAYCTSLQAIRLPDSLTSIGYSAFEDCTGLREIYLPKSLKEINIFAFCNVNATVYYPASCAGKDWVGQNYGGELVWKPY